MLTLDAIRAAALAPQPWSRLDELVRAELTAGRLVPAVRDEYRQLLGPARETPGLTDEAEDALMDTLDALTGNCARRYAYENPPVLPSEEEVAALPRWARVAFAARCARRALPFYLVGWPDAPAVHVRQISEAVRTTEAAAAQASQGPVRVLRQRDTNGAAGRLIPLADAALKASRGAGKPVASHAALAAAHAGESAMDGDAKYTMFGSISGLLGAVAELDLFPAIRRDFDQVARVAAYRQWDDDTPVSPDVFGPLWPEGPPAGWPAGPDTPQHTGVEMDLLVGERVKDQVAEDEAVNLFNALSRYHLARTGRPLLLDDLRPYLPIRTAVGV